MRRPADPCPHKLTFTLDGAQYQALLQATVDDGAPVVPVSERLWALVALWREDEELRGKVLERARGRLAV
jgi:hypothetical protein